MRTIPVVGAVVLVATLATAQVSVHVYVPAVRVTVAPPPLRVETQPPPPTAAHVWLAGHWAWRKGRYVWIPGHWVLAPGPGYAWVEPRWVQQTGGRWGFYEGYWAPTVAPAPSVAYEPVPPPVEPVVVTVAPPAPIVEVRPAVPFAGAIWIPGYWQWSGVQHVWLAGRWSAPRPGFVWVGARWRHAGPQWRFEPGYWRRR
jgi:WXXGXW repeat (2 copies)